MLAPDPVRNPSIVEPSPALAVHEQYPVLEIDLAAIRANWRAMAARYAGPVVSAVVKSDAYGLGLDRVAATLADAGCATFWVNDLDEAVRLRMALPDMTVYALFGLGLHGPVNFVGTGIVPVLSSLAEVELCADAARRGGRRMPVAVQLDTGLGRLGLTRRDVDRLAGRRDLLDALEMRCWVSHLAAFDLPDEASNLRQRAALVDWVGRLKPAPISLASSAAMYMGADWHFDIARIGSALFGVQTSVRWQEGLRPCYRLTAPVLRVADLPAGSTLGYRGAARLERRSRIATTILGYANGLPQAFAGFGTARFDDHAAPFVGGLSMNLSMLDVTDLPECAATAGARCIVFDENSTIDSAAARLGCAPNALLTQIGGNTRRRYVDEAATPTGR